MASAAPERRLANDGRSYTRTEFVDWYGVVGGRLWEAAVADNGDAAELGPVPAPVAAPAPAIDAAVTSASDRETPGTSSRGAAQPPAGSGDALAITDGLRRPFSGACASHPSHRAAESIEVQRTRAIWAELGRLDDESWDERVGSLDDESWDADEESEEPFELETRQSAFSRVIDEEEYEVWVRRPRP